MFLSNQISPKWTIAKLLIFLTPVSAVRGLSGWFSFTGSATSFITLSNESSCLATFSKISSFVVNRIVCKNCHSSQYFRKCHNMAYYAQALKSMMAELFRFGKRTYVAKSFSATQNTAWGSSYFALKYFGTVQLHDHILRSAVRVDTWLVVILKHILL